MKKSLRYIFLAFSVSLIITVVISLLFFRNLSSLKSYNEGIEHTQKVLDKIENVQYLLTEAENSQRGFVITLDSSFLVSFAKTKSIIYPQANALRDLLWGNEVQQQYFIKLRNTIALRFQVLNETIERVLDGDDNKFYENSVRGKKLMADFNALATKMEQEELKSLKEKKEQKEKFESATPTYLFLILIASVVFQILSFLMIIRELRRRYRYQKELERKINELNMSNAELEQIAFIASHDLQEPLRKMRTFGGRLLLLYNDQLNEEGKMILNKIDAAARRMQGLIQDVVDYTNLINSEEALQIVDLNVCLQDVEKSLSNLIDKEKATITSNELPKIKGYPFQLQLLFVNLVHNAVKFSKEGVNPEVRISAEEITASNPYHSNGGIKNERYLLIKVQDNGIGFENEFAKRIFVMFQRLHTQNSNYEGKGIGLSICKRVMTNHNGFISAEGEPGHGATFNLYFPL